MAEQTSEEQWILVYRAREAWQTAIARGWLADAGIPAMQVNPITDMDVWGKAPAPLWSGVRVPQSYRAAAEHVLKDMLPEA